MTDDAIIPPINQTLKAAFWMLGAIGSFTAMALAGRSLGADYDTFEIMFYRSVVGFVIVMAVARHVGTLHEINRDALGLQVLRNLVHFSGQNLWFYAVTAIPLAQVFAFEFTTPLWVIVLSPILLGERLTRVRTIAAFMGFVGILIVARPSVAGLNSGVLAAAGCAVFFALTFITTKKLTARQSITGIMFYLTLLQLIFGLITAGYDGDIALPTLASTPLLALVGVCGLLAHFCITNALRLAPAAVVSPIDFARLPVIAILAMLIYGETVDVWVYVGGIIIFAGNYLNIWVETRRKPA
ncbi:Riboflavin transporter [Sulfitobacter sp. THAF37]|uniref:DMT family transporter n=1 Tax=Sulfitobacter sp. THAF37 TaxID=2587855 RepID=UPI0012A9DA5D|nr:DMT family transporter [Sulfitobacter sp. THAF37]QFT59836.1 Riboflavin transporter [Sulfitobacter sp. THAF37]